MDHPFGDPTPGEAVTSPDFNPTHGYEPRDKRFARRGDGKWVRIDQIANENPVTQTLMNQEARQPSAPTTVAVRMSVYDCIVAVSQEIAQTGISKNRSNAQQNYKFRGIDDVLNALSPLLAKYRLVILPRVLSRTVVERETRNGGVLFYVTIEAEFDFVSAADGSIHTVKTYGEAMDSADKATNKAMSAAYKYAAFQTFCIPTEGDNDADAVTHEVRPRAIPQADSRARGAGGDARPRVDAAKGEGTALPGTIGLPAKSSDEGPDLGVDLPDGARRIVSVTPSPGGNYKAEIVFTSPVGESGQTALRCYTDRIVSLAEQFCRSGEPCFVGLKKSASGNWRVEDLVRVPPDYEPAKGLPQPKGMLTDKEIPF